MKIQLQLFGFISHSLDGDFVLGGGEGTYLKKIWVNRNHDTRLYFSFFSAFRRESFFSSILPSTFIEDCYTVSLSKHL